MSETTVVWLVSSNRWDGELTRTKSIRLQWEGGRTIGGGSKKCDLSIEKVPEQKKKNGHKNSFPPQLQKRLMDELDCPFLYLGS